MKFIISLSVFLLIDLVGVSQVAPKVLWHKSTMVAARESSPLCYTNQGFGFPYGGRDGIRGRSFAKIFLVKTDSGGKLLWQKEFGKRGYNLGNCVVEADDGNYLIAGTLNFDAALIKVEAKTGKTLWSKTWDLGSEDSFEGLTLSNDGGIVLTGYRDGLAEGTFLNWGRDWFLKQMNTVRKNGVGIYPISLLPAIESSSPAPDLYSVFTQG